MSKSSESVPPLFFLSSTKNEEGQEVPQKLIVYKVRKTPLKLQPNKLFKKKEQTSPHILEEYEEILNIYLNQIEAALMTVINRISDDEKQKFYAQIEELDFPISRSDIATEILTYRFFHQLKRHYDRFLKQEVSSRYPEVIEASNPFFIKKTVDRLISASNTEIIEANLPEEENSFSAKTLKTSINVIQNQEFSTDNVKGGAQITQVSQDIKNECLETLQESVLNEKNTENAEQSHHAVDRDRQSGFYGVKLGELYQNYFSDEGKASIFSQVFIDSDLAERLPQKPRILGIGSGPGMVEMMVYRILKDKYGKEPSLILSDKMPEALGEFYKGHAPKEGDKVKTKVFDAKNIPYADKTFHLVIMRSVLHYEQTRELQKKVLEEVERVLQNDYYLLNQELAFPNETEVELSQLKRNLVGKNSYYMTADDVLNLHKEAFPKGFVKRPSAQPANMSTTKEDYVTRFHLQNQPDILKKVEDFIRKNRAKMVNLQLLDDKNFSYDVPFQLIIAKKKRTGL